MIGQSVEYIRFTWQKIYAHCSVSIPLNRCCNTSRLFVTVHNIRKEGGFCTQNQWPNIPNLSPDSEFYKNWTRNKKKHYCNNWLMHTCACRYIRYRPISYCCKGALAKDTPCFSKCGNFSNKSHLNKTVILYLTSREANWAPAGGRKIVCWYPPSPMRPIHILHNVRRRIILVAFKTAYYQF